MPEKCARDTGIAQRHGSPALMKLRLVEEMGNNISASRASWNRQTHLLVAVIMFLEPIEILR